MLIGKDTRGRPRPHGVDGQDQGGGYTVRMSESVRLNCEHECVSMGGRMSLGIEIPRADMCQRLCSSARHSIWDIAMPAGWGSVAAR